jgi:hypothetical protein
MAEGRMSRNVGYLFAADIDHATIAQALKMLLSSLKHGVLRRDVTVRRYDSSGLPPCGANHRRLL